MIARVRGQVGEVTVQELQGGLYIRTAVVFVEIILVILSLQAFIGHILCTAHFVLGPEKSKRTREQSLTFRGLLVH